MTFIDRNLHRKIDLGQIARSMNISASRLRHLIKDEAGISPLQYLKAQRIRRAIELLENSFLNIYQVMTSVGFKDLSHFTRVFKSIHGLPPAQYRKRHLRLKHESDDGSDSHNQQMIAMSAKK
jgi:AraC-like DNA-binding protein